MDTPREPVELLADGLTLPVAGAVAGATAAAGAGPKVGNGNGSKLGASGLASAVGSGCAGMDISCSAAASPMRAGSHI
jgi:hypothetical protein